MEHTIEPAASGRAKCRGCGEKIAKGELRLGARLPNPFVEGELVLWFHLFCGACKRPQALLDALTSTSESVEDASELEAWAERSLELRRLPRLNAASRAPTGRAKCRHCKESIDKGSFRIGLTFFDEEEGRFEPGGFLHVLCAPDYFETSALIERIARFSPALEPDELEDIRGLLEGHDAAPAT